MRKMLMVVGLMAGMAGAQSSDYIRTWQKAENGYFGTQKAGMNQAIYQAKANLGQSALIITSSLYKVGAGVGIFDCIVYENAGATKDTVFLKITRSTKSLSVSSLNGALKPFFDLASQNDALSKISGYTGLCSSDGVDRTETLKISTVQIPIGARLLIGNPSDRVYATINSTGLDFDFQVTPPAP